MDKTSLPGWLQQALRVAQAQRWSELEALLAPHLAQPAALHLLGLSQLERGQPEQAVQILAQALARGGDPALHLELGRLCAQLQQAASACQHFQQAQALGLLTEDADRHRYALALHASGQAQTALPLCQDLLTRHPQHGGLWMLLGNLYSDLGQSQAALQAYTQSERQQPQDPLLAFNLARWHSQQGELSQAESYLKACLQQQADFAPAWHQLGLIYQARYQGPEAQSALTQALALAPDNLSLRMDLAQLHRDRLQLQQAEAVLAEACDRQPVLRYAQAFLLPPVLASAAELATWNVRLQNQLAALATAPVPLRDPWQQVGRLPYYLPYLGLPERPLMTQLAQTLTQACPELLWERPGCWQSKVRPQRLKIGLVSAFFCEHTVFDLFGYLLRDLDRSRLEVWAFSLGLKEDAATALARQWAEHFVKVPRELEPARQTLAAAELDILLYLDVGMDPLSWFLAAARLAPCQALTWGHGSTTGLSNLDAFLSDLWMDTPEGQMHYSEKLLRLPQMLGQWSLSSLASPLPPTARSDFGLPPDQRLYLCPQSLYKFHPDFDQALAGILAADPDGVLVLLTGLYPEWQAQLENRWQGQLDLSRVCWLPRLSRTDYLRLLSCGDLMLDPWPFGGGLTTMQALALGVPVVSRRGTQLKNRTATALATRMNGFEGLAESPSDYIQKALLLAQRGRDPELAARYEASLAGPAAALACADSLIALWEQICAEA